MSWTPKFALDLQTASVNAFQKTMADFEDWRPTQEPRNLNLSNRWTVITPEIAEGMLLRNPIGANRKAALPTVRYYARQMLGGKWKQTGQAVLFDTDGKLIDAGHRLWASYLSGASFPTYLIGDVPADPHVFAFIDNGKTRTAADALATAGLNGLSKLLSTVVSMAMHFEHGLYTASTKRSLDKVSPIEVVEYLQQHDNLRLATRLMVGEHKSAAAVIDKKDVASFVAYQIIELHGEDVLDEFMNELGRRNDDAEDGSAIIALQRALAEDANSKEQMQKHQILGIVIKGFNSWINQEPVKKITLKVNETFPRFVRPQPVQQAAE
jgi:hypothetical protein